MSHNFCFVLVLTFTNSEISHGSPNFQLLLKMGQPWHAFHAAVIGFSWVTPARDRKCACQFSPGFSPQAVHAAQGPIHALRFPDRLCGRWCWLSLLLNVNSWGIGQGPCNTVPSMHWEPSKGRVEELLQILLHLLIVTTLSVDSVYTDHYKELVLTP